MTTGTDFTLNMKPNKLPYEFNPAWLDELFDDKGNPKLRETQAHLQTIRLRIRELAHGMMVDHTGWPFSQPPEFDVDYRPEFMAYMIRAFVRYASEKHFLIEVPKTWWDAVKDRFLPRWHWLRKRVSIDRVRYSYEVIYPKIALQNEYHSIKVHKVEVNPNRDYSEDEDDY